MQFSKAFTLGFLAAAFVTATPVQNQIVLSPGEVASVHDAPASQPEPRKLKGRFLHVTDIHPDPFYLTGSDPSERCHRGKGDAGVLGAETTGCDTPFSLVNETFAWIKENLRDEIDFVIWTGDSARHDNDANIPRSDSQIFTLNRRITQGMVDVFGKPDNLGDDDPTNDLVVPIIPTLGNNDIFPHNIMTDGPNKITREFSDIWRNFIPQDQYHVFDKGAYFWTQVVPGTNGKMGLASKGGLSVISLNTIYFFGSNAAVDGCDLKGEPGYEQMEWLKIQLQLMRDIGMKAILIGHVPPAWTSTKQSWDETCWKKYVLWSKQYRDVIVGSIYGHMNLDHFMVHDSDELKPPHDDSKRKKKKKPKRKWTGRSAEEMVAPEMDPSEFDEENPVYNVQNAESYLNSLREAFSYLPTPIGVVGKSDEEDDPYDENQNADYSQKIGGRWGERYVLSIVGPSVVPNYFPTLRVIEYNITGLDGVNVVVGGSNAKPNDDLQAMRNKDPSTPNPPSKTAPPGPAYSMQPFTFLGITQYYANLTRINGPKKKADDQHLELRDSTQDRTFRYELEYNTRTDKIYKLKDMTVKSYLKLAREIVDATRRGNKKQGDKDKTRDIDGSAVECGDLDVNEGCDVEEEKRKKRRKSKKHHHKLKDHIWHTFVKRAFVGTIEGDELGM
ncbi:Metallo-dependent phosphatase-like protein [Tuber indicum]|nr:Metallo-dependent phosphatase-like protein [Tuber indicum]